MMTRRGLYSWLLRLHPAAFRERFGEEMLAIFDEVAASAGTGTNALFQDLAVSIFRQRMWRSGSGGRTEPVAAVAGGTPLFVTLEVGRPLAPMILRGGLISLMLFLAAGMTMGRGGGGFAGLPFLIGAHRPSPRILPVDRASIKETTLNSEVRFGREPEDPWRPIAKAYFGIVRVLGALDADQDLIISGWEIITAPPALRRLDANHDGKLDAEECGFRLGEEAAYRQIDPETLRRAHFAFVRAQPVLAALDSDGDGEISASEIAASALALGKLDRNNDGRLTPDEVIPDRLANQAALILSRAAREPEGSPLRELVKGADRNGDGVTTLEELTRELRLQSERNRQLDGARKANALPTPTIP